MAITRIKNSSIANKGPKYDNALAGLPYQPVIGTATDGGTGTTVSVAFTENNVAGAGVTYTALSSPGSLTGTGSSSPITVSGLTSGTAYTFQVKAGNSLGDSAYSAASNSVTPVQPTAYESIATVNGNASSIVIELTGIPSTFKHLQLRFALRANSGGGTTAGTGVLKYNGSGLTAYHYLEGDGASATASGATGVGNMPYAITSSSATANILTYGVIDILDYASTTKNKTARAFYGTDRNGSGTVEIWSGFRNNTSAITSLSITGDYAFTTTSQIALYGIKESS